MEQEELSSIAWHAILDQLGETPNPPPPTFFPAGPPAISQPAAVTAPPTLVPVDLYSQSAPSTLVPAQPYNQPGTVIQGQNLYQFPVNDISTTAAPITLTPLTAPSTLVPVQPYNQPGTVIQEQNLYQFPVNDISTTAAPITLTPLTAPSTFMPVQPYNQPGTVIQEQNLYQLPVNGIPTAAAPTTVPLAAPPNTSSNVIKIPDCMMQYLRPVGVLNGVLVCDFAPSAPPLNTSPPKKRKRDEQQDNDRSYIKKPPNAFMLYLNEQRAKVMAEFNIKGSATVNAVMGERWKLLSKDQQAKYYEKAEEEKFFHAQQYPKWSAKENYGKKKKSRRSTCSRASASKPLQEAQEAKWTSVNVPVCGTFQLPQVNDVLPASHANSSPSTSVDQVLPASHANSPPSTSVDQVLPACHANSPPSTDVGGGEAVQRVQLESKEANFFRDTGEDLQLMCGDRDPFLPAMTPQEPITADSGFCTSPQGVQIRPDSSPFAPIDPEAMLEFDSLYFDRELSPIDFSMLN
ncbi:transcription factor 7-like 1 isoform X2 [Archocentrus centrarchus]|uniref:transcription factor 7-like 1 isoform X2 n=1 Tax=Archocentrus centrarchus TaxID=63155 RepID=UPI0011E9C51C|nr:transcription factor 7-like 1 isoform X2 [Archocentrus centrarchus]